MKIFIFILLIGLLSTQILFALASDLFISEYIEGSANNKAIEIYNGTGSDINLSAYSIKKANNGQGWPVNENDFFTFPENAVIHSFDVWVIANNEASSAILNVADIILNNSDFNYTMAFNGNDAIGLFKNDELIDVIGIPTDGPTEGWDVAGVSVATKDHTLIRKPNINQGNTDWSASAGTTSDNSEWIVKDVDYFSDLGQHTFNGAPDIVPPTIVSVTATSETQVQILFSEEITPESANDVNNYQISNLQIISATLQNDNRTVILVTSQQTENANYTLIVNNIEDLAGNMIEEDTSINFTGYVNPYTSIAEIRENVNDYVGKQVTIKAIVTIGAGVLSSERLNVYVQDESKRGIELFDFNITSQYEEDFVKGNEVEVTGTVDLYVNQSSQSQTLEIKDFTYNVLSSDNPIPFEKMSIESCNNLDLEGTYLQTTGIVTDSYWAGGGTNIEISDNSEPAHTLPIRVWDSTGINCDDFQAGFILQVRGVGSIYHNSIQIVPGYPEDMSEGVLFPYDFISWIPEHPTTDTTLTVIFNNENTHYDQVNINWKINKDLTFHTEYMTTNEDSTEFYFIFDNLKAGTRYELYFEAFSDTLNYFFPEDAPENTITIDIPSFNLTAKITIPAKPFDPKRGETFPIDITASNGDKAIVRIYNIEGKLKTTLYNQIITSNSGIVRIYWDGKDKNYNILPIGLYICHLEVIDKNSGKSKTDKAPIMIGTELK